MADLPPVGAIIEACNLTSERFQVLNGVRGKVIKHHNQGEGKGVLPLVEFPEPHGKMMLKTQNIKFVRMDDGAGGGGPQHHREVMRQKYPKGSEVMIQNLKQQQEYNGKRGRVEAYQPTSDGKDTKMVVDFGPPVGRLALRSQNLKMLTLREPSRAPEGGGTPLPADYKYSPGGGVRRTSGQMSPSAVPKGMVKATERLDTYKAWPPHLHSATVNPRALSDAGFFHNPTQRSPDRCTCFSCGYSLVQWGPTDEPWTEHETHVPQCPYVRAHKASQKAVKALAKVKRVKPELAPIEEDGFLKKQKPGITKGWDLRFFTLRGSVLMYFEEKGRIDISRGVDCKNVPGDDKTFTVNAVGQQRDPFVLQAQDAEECRKWVEAFSGSQDGPKISKVEKQAFWDFEAAEAEARAELTLECSLEGSDLAGRCIAAALGSFGTLELEYRDRAVRAQIEREEEAAIGQLHYTFIKRAAQINAAKAMEKANARKYLQERFTALRLNAGGVSKSKNTGELAQSEAAARVQVAMTELQELRDNLAHLLTLSTTDVHKISNDNNTLRDSLKSMQMTMANPDLPPPGAGIYVHALKNRADLNGKCATVIEGQKLPDGTKVVLVDFEAGSGQNAPMLLRQQNIYPAPNAELCSMIRRPVQEEVEKLKAQLAELQMGAGKARDAVADAEAADERLIDMQQQLNGSQQRQKELLSEMEALKQQLEAAGRGVAPANAALPDVAVPGSGITLKGDPRVTYAPVPTIGSRVVAHGLKSMDALNGQFGKVIDNKQLPDGTHVPLVEFPATATSRGATVMLRRENVTPVPDPFALDAIACDYLRPQLDKNRELQAENDRLRREFSPTPFGAPAGAGGGGSGGAQKGDTVVAHGLVNKAFLNGQGGTVLELQTLPDGTPAALVKFADATMTLRAINYTTLPREEVQAYVAGAAARAGQEEVKALRAEVAELKRGGAREAGGIPAVGTTVVGDGLKNRTDLNGRPGVITQHSALPDGTPTAVVRFLDVGCRGSGSAAGSRQPSRQNSMSPPLGLPPRSPSPAGSDMSPPTTPKSPRLTGPVTMMMKQENIMEVPTLRVMDALQREAFQAKAQLRRLSVQQSSLKSQLEHLSGLADQAKDHLGRAGSPSPPASPRSPRGSPAGAGAGKVIAFNCYDSDLNGGVGTVAETKKLDDGSTAVVVAFPDGKSHVLRPHQVCKIPEEALAALETRLGSGGGAGGASADKLPELSATLLLHSLRRCAHLNGYLGEVTKFQTLPNGQTVVMVRVYDDAKTEVALRPANYVPMEKELYEKIQGLAEGNTGAPALQTELAEAVGKIAVLEARLAKADKTVGIATRPTLAPGDHVYVTDAGLGTPAREAHVVQVQEESVVVRYAGDVASVGAAVRGGDVHAHPHRDVVAALVGEKEAEVRALRAELASARDERVTASVESSQEKLQQILAGSPRAGKGCHFCQELRLEVNELLKQTELERRAQMQRQERMLRALEEQSSKRSAEEMRLCSLVEQLHKGESTGKGSLLAMDYDLEAHRLVPDELHRAFSDLKVQMTRDMEAYDDREDALIRDVERAIRRGEDPRARMEELEWLRESVVDERRRQTEEEQRLLSQLAARRELETELVRDMHSRAVGYHQTLMDHEQKLLDVLRPREGQKGQVVTQLTAARRRLQDAAARDRQQLEAFLLATHGVPQRAKEAEQLVRGVADPAVRVALETIQREGLCGKLHAAIEDLNAQLMRKNVGTVDYRSSGRGAASPGGAARALSPDSYRGSISPARERDGGGGAYAESAIENLTNIRRQLSDARHNLDTLQNEYNQAREALQSATTRNASLKAQADSLHLLVKAKQDEVDAMTSAITRVLELPMLQNNARRTLQEVCPFNDEQKLQWLFRHFDADRDGRWSAEETARARNLVSHDNFGDFCRSLGLESKQYTGLSLEDVAFMYERDGADFLQRDYERARGAQTYGVDTLLAVEAWCRMDVIEEAEIEERQLLWRYRQLLVAKIDVQHPIRSALIAVASEAERQRRENAAHEEKVMTALLYGDRIRSPSPTRHRGGSGMDPSMAGGDVYGSAGRGPYSPQPHGAGDPVLSMLGNIHGEVQDFRHSLTPPRMRQIEEDNYRLNRANEQLKHEVNQLLSGAGAGSLMRGSHGRSRSPHRNAKYHVARGGRTARTVLQHSGRCLLWQRWVLWRVWAIMQKGYRAAAAASARAGAGTPQRGMDRYSLAMSPTPTTSRPPSLSMFFKLEKTARTTIIALREDTMYSLQKFMKSVFGSLYRTHSYHLNYIRVQDDGSRVPITVYESASRHGIEAEEMGTRLSLLRWKLDDTVSRMQVAEVGGVLRAVKQTLADVHIPPDIKAKINRLSLNYGGIGSMQKRLVELEQKMDWLRSERDKAVAQATAAEARLTDYRSRIHKLRDQARVRNDKAKPSILNLSSTSPSPRRVEVDTPDRVAKWANQVQHPQVTPPPRGSGMVTPSTHSPYGLQRGWE